MPKLRLSEDVRRENPDLAEVKEFSLPGKEKPEDKKHLFKDAWEKWGDGTAYEEEYKFAAPLRRFAADFCFVSQRLIVEVDGGNWMVVDGKAVGRHTKDSDYEKTNTAACLGYRLVRFSPGMLKKDPVGCAFVVQVALHHAD